MSLLLLFLTVSNNSLIFSEFNSGIVRLRICEYAETFEGETHVQLVLDINTRDLRERRHQAFWKLIYWRVTFTFTFLASS